MSPAGAPGGRIFFDTTFTRTQVGNVGITRTVRRLLEQLQRQAEAEFECVPVAFHTRGFRSLPSDAVRPADAVASEAPATSGLAARVLRWALGSRLRRKITAATPLPMLAVIWFIYSWITYDALARGAPRVDFRQGDLLLLCDASWNYRAWVAARAARRAGARVVVMVHDLIPLRNPEFGAALMTFTFGQWLPAMLACSDAVICNSAATMEDLQDYARSRGWPLPPIHHFRLGSDVVPRSRDSAVRPELVTMLTGAPCFAAVGSIEARKNLGLLLTVFDQLWAEGVDLRLVVVGRPTPECDALVQAMASHPQRGRFFLPVFDASDAELQYVYSGTRALIFPSLAEGFGLPLVEARTRGAIVIASDLPVFRELADSGVLVFDRHSPQELRNRVLELAAADKRSSIAPMAPFTWSDSARQLLARIRPLLQGSE